MDHIYQISNIYQIDQMIISIYMPVHILNIDIKNVLSIYYHVHYPYELLVIQNKYNHINTRV